MSMWQDTSAHSLYAERAWLARGMDEHARGLLGALVGMAKAATAAAAASISTLDEEECLVFQAVSGDGEDVLVGTRFSADRGIAGWVASTGEPIAVENPSADTRFARDIAVRSGLIPSSIVAVPVSHQGAVLGVLEVLDPAPSVRSNIADLDRLTGFASSAGAAIYALARSATMLRASSVPGSENSEMGALIEAISALLDGLGHQDREATLSLLTNLCSLLERRAYR